MMTSLSSFDRQLADVVWIMITAMRAGYTLPQVFAQLAAEAPEPTAKICGEVVDDLKQGITLNQALLNWRDANPSIYLGDVVAAILKQQTDDPLPDVLEPVCDAIYEKAGSDGALSAVMETLARSVGAQPRR